MSRRCMNGLGCLGQNFYSAHAKKKNCFLLLFGGLMESFCNHSVGVALGFRI